MTTWNYRVIKKDDALAIYEVYYDDNGKIEATTSTACSPSGESMAELEEDLLHFKAALLLPVLDYENLPFVSQ